MLQWREIKARHPDALVFFRVGDFYELFNEDAVEGSKLLDLTLTSRNNGGSKAPLAGIPAHALDNYLRRLVSFGKRVAIRRWAVRSEVGHIERPRRMICAADIEGFAGTVRHGHFSTPNNGKGPLLATLP